MLQGRIYKLIKEKIGDYLYGFKEDQLKIGIFSGQVKLENVTLKHDKLNQNPTLQASPIAIKAGMLGLLQINVSLYSFLRGVWLFFRLNILICTTLMS